MDRERVRECFIRHYFEKSENKKELEVEEEIGELQEAETDIEVSESKECWLVPLETVEYTCGGTTLENRGKIEGVIIFLDSSPG